MPGRIEEGATEARLRALERRMDRHEERFDESMRLASESHLQASQALTELKTAYEQGRRQIAAAINHVEHDVCGPNGLKLAVDRLQQANKLRSAIFATLFTVIGLLTGIAAIAFTAYDHLRPQVTENTARLHQLETKIDK